MTKEELFKIMKGTVIVSCQALPGEPLYDAERSIMPYMAMAAKQAGGTMIRTSSVRDITEIKNVTKLPVIGLIKRDYDDYDGRITVTMREVDECVEAKADIVSIDCSNGRRGDGRTAPEFLKLVREKYPDIVIMADCASYEEGIAAYQAGADIVGSTLSGYTKDTADRLSDDPDYDVIARWAKVLPCPIIAEGRIHTPEQAKRMLELGAWAVVVGGAITRPYEIARRYYKIIKESEQSS